MTSTYSQNKSFIAHSPTALRTVGLEEPLGAARVRDPRRDRDAQHTSGTSARRTKNAKRAKTRIEVAGVIAERAERATTRAATLENQNRSLFTYQNIN